MKTNNTSDLVLVVYELTSLYEMITLMDDHDEITDHLGLQVKGKGEGLVLLPTLKRCHKIIDKIDSDVDIFEPIHDDFSDCVEYLDKNYSTKSKWLKLPENLRKEDFRKISSDLDRIIRTLIGYSKELVIIPSKTQKKNSNKIVKGLDKKTREDYNEALKCLDYDLTTGSFMLLCRVAEKMATTYYEKFIQQTSKNKSWNQMYHEIKEKKANRSILALFDFLRTKRNKAQHPGERFDKKECEKILHYLDDFQIEISKSIIK